MPGGGGAQSRRCSHCLVQNTPPCRTGQVGSKTLCNACGVRYKFGRLLPEYRPACSPTFSGEIHSNDHRKVLEMRRKKEGDGGFATPPVQKPSSQQKLMRQRLEEMNSKDVYLENQLDSFQISTKRRAKLLEEQSEKVDLKKNELDSNRNLSKERCNEQDLGQKEFGSKQRKLDERIRELEFKEKQFANLIKFRVVAEQSEGNSPCVDIGFMVTMDGKGLQLFLNDHIKNHDSIAGKVLEALKLSIDPAKLVLDALEGFYPPHLKKGNVEFEGNVVKRSCILLLQLIMRISPEIRDDVKHAALTLAAEWKGKMRPAVEDSLEMLGFLSLLAAYELDVDFDADKVLSRYQIVPQHTQTHELYPLLGYTDEIRDSQCENNLVFGLDSAWAKHGAKGVNSGSSLCQTAAFQPKQEAFKVRKLNRGKFPSSDMGSDPGTRTEGAAKVSSISKIKVEGGNVSAEDVSKEVGIPKVDAKARESGTSRKTNRKRGREFYDCLDPEFSDFDKDKDEKCFSVDQIWACYDTTDCLPRFYAKIKKVFSPGFKLRITWLEPDPEAQGEIDWVNQELPVGCGKFIHGDTEVTSKRLTFSHQMHFEKGIGRGSYLIYPRKGETWALFKDWDIGWSFDPENHKNYIYQIAEILSDFSHDSGIKVSYLKRIKGFVSLFERMMWGGDVIIVIPSSELFRFSHRVPSFKLTGAERESVPEGSFELDPASLSANPNELWQPEDMKVKAQSMIVKVNCSSLKSTIASENTRTFNKGVASKLIDKSNMVVSSPGKRSVHISKGSVSGNATVGKTSHQVSQNQVLRNSFGAQNKTNEYLNPQFSGSNHHHRQLIQPDQSNGRKSLWTCCPFNIVCCQNCSRSFMAYDSGARGELQRSDCVKTGNQGIACSSSLGQPESCQQKHAIKHEAIKLCAKITGGFQSYLLGSKVSSSTKVTPEAVIRPAVASVVGGSLKTKGKNHWPTMTEPASDEGAQGELQRLDQGKSGGQGVASRSVSQLKVGAQSTGMFPCSLSRSSRTGGSDLVTRTGGATEIGGCLKTKGKDDRLVDIPVLYAPTMKNTNEQRGRMSIAKSRACYFSYNESLRDEYDFMCPSKRFREKKVTLSGEEEQKLEAELEFSGFDMDREESSFSVDQVWACYDSIDGMPRLYAQVRKALSNRFMLEITWLNADPKDQCEIDWVKEGLPVACGKFVHGKTAISCEHSEFSHQIFCEKGTKGSYEIYPRKGETWALFKDWDISWKSEPENHKDYVYEIVEILTEYSHYIGIHVAYLGKVEGFVSLFQRSTRLGVTSFLIPSGELLRFSHQIPAFKITGAERGVPVGSFELDPASLPSNINELCNARKEMIETESTNAKEMQIACIPGPFSDNSSPISSTTKKRSWKEDINIYHRKMKVKDG